MKLFSSLKVTYCGGSSDKCETEMIVTVANVSMPAPGVVHHDYTDAPLAPQSEDWRLVSWPHPDYALVTRENWTGQLGFISSGREGFFC